MLVAGLWALVPEVQSADQLAGEELPAQSSLLVLIMLLRFLIIFPLHMLIGTHIHTATLNTTFIKGVPTGSFANSLTRITADSSDSVVSKYLSSPPGTRERVHRFIQGSEKGNMHTTG